MRGFLGYLHGNGIFKIVFINEMDESEDDDESSQESEYEAML